MSFMKKIYLDNNATTQTDPLVIEAIREELEREPANPSSIHSLGKAAQGRLRKARERIAAYFSASSNELIFTSSGTEALNLAILGLQPRGHIITSDVEHLAVLKPLATFENPITYLSNSKLGAVTVPQVKEALRPDTSLIVLSAANSETGVKNPTTQIAEIAQRYNIPFLVDGVGLLGKESITIPAGVTAMAFSAHKCHGPQGVGLLYLKKRQRLSPLLLGGGQESNRRPGTENLPGIIGFDKAIQLLSEKLPKVSDQMRQLRDHFEMRLKEEIPRLKINGEAERVCNTSNLTFPEIDGEGLLIQLDREGLAASMGSACSSGALEPSHVLLNMGLSQEEALSSLRFSLSRFTSIEEIEKAVHIIALAVNKSSGRRSFLGQ